MKALLALVLVAFAAHASAQSTGAAIGGIVVDESGARVAAASVTIANAATGRTLTLSTGAGGEDPRGRPAARRVRRGGRARRLRTHGPARDAAGRRRRRGQRHAAARRRGCPHRRAAEVPLVETARSQPSSTITKREVDALPVLERNFLVLAQLLPGSGPLNSTVGRFAVTKFGGAAGSAERIFTRSLTAATWTTRSGAARRSTSARTRCRNSRCSAVSSTRSTATRCRRSFRWRPDRVATRVGKRILFRPRRCAERAVSVRDDQAAVRRAPDRRLGRRSAGTQPHARFGAYEHERCTTCASSRCPRPTSSPRRRTASSPRPQPMPWPRCGSITASTRSTDYRFATTPRTSRRAAAPQTSAPTAARWMSSIDRTASSRKHVDALATHRERAARARNHPHPRHDAAHDDHGHHSSGGQHRPDEPRFAGRVAHAVTCCPTRFTDTRPGTISRPAASWRWRRTTSIRACSSTASFSSRPTGRSIRTRRRRGRSRSASRRQPFRATARRSWRDFFRTTGGYPSACTSTPASATTWT